MSEGWGVMGWRGQVLGDAVSALAGSACVCAVEELSAWGWVGVMNGGGVRSQPTRQLLIAAPHGEQGHAPLRG